VPGAAEDTLDLLGSWSAEAEHLTRLAPEDPDGAPPHEPEADGAPPPARAALAIDDDFPPS